MSSVTIDRFELVFLNPEENRWQMFQEHPTGSQESAIYRKQAQEFLSSVRKSFERHCNAVDPNRLSDLNNRLKEKIRKDRTVFEYFFSGTREKKELPSAIYPIDKIVVERSKDNNGEIQISIKDLRSALRRVTDPEGGGSTKLDYRENLNEIREKLQTIIELEKIDPSSCKKVFDALGSEKDEIILMRSDALSLISTLFVARHWDVLGRLSYPSEVMPQTNANPCPATLSTFSYSIDYLKGEKANLLRSAAERALGYEVNVRVAGIDSFLQNREAYFQFCHDPQEPRETFWYCFYGLLIDGINAGLSGTGQTDKTVHIVCIPLRICGYDHFLQLYLHVDSATDIALAWDPGCSHLMTRALLDAPYGEPTPYGRPATFRILLKECLRELLVQMHIAAFQHHVLGKIKEHPADKLENSIAEIFSQHAPNLVRLEKVFLSGQSYEYRADTDAPFKRWCKQDSLEPVPSEEMIVADAHLTAIEAGHAVAHIPWEKIFEGALNPLFLGTGSQRLIEQYQWLKGQIGLRDTRLELIDRLRKLQ